MDFTNDSSKFYQEAPKKLQTGSADGCKTIWLLLEMSEVLYSGFSIRLEEFEKRMRFV